MSVDPPEGTEGTELESLRPYLGLAREIRDAVDRFVGDDMATAETLAAAFGSISEAELARVAAAVFAQLSPSEQWAVLGGVLGEARLRALVEQADAAAVAEVRRRVGTRAVASTAAAEGQLDLRWLLPGSVLTVLLFRPDDVASVLGRGARSDVCAREITCVATDDPGVVRVVTDRFNPRHGLFVTADYDESTWSAERVVANGLVRLGAAGVAGQLQPLIRPGGRLDVELDGRVSEGRLHVGAVLLDGEDVFAIGS